MIENKDNPFLSDRINKRQTVKTYIETRDFGNIKSKGPDLEFCSLEEGSVEGEVDYDIRSSANPMEDYIEEDYQSIVAFDQHMWFSRGMNIEIDESVYKDIAEEIDELVHQGKVESDDDSGLEEEKLDYEAITREQKERLARILVKDGKENFGKLHPPEVLKELNEEGRRKPEPEPLPKPEEVNAFQSIRQNRGLPDLHDGREAAELCAESLSKIPDSIKVGAVVAAGLGIMSKSTLGSLCIMGASAYAWDRWLDDSLAKRNYRKPSLDSGKDRLGYNGDEEAYGPKLTDDDFPYTNEQLKAFLIKKYLDSNPVLSGNEVDQIVDCENLSAVTSIASSKAEAAVYAYMATMRRPRAPPPSSVPSESDLEVQVSEKRVFFDAQFNSNTKSYKCLFDPGATSSVISRYALVEEEAKLNITFPRLPREAKVKAFGDTDPRITMEIVLVDIYVDGLLRSRYAPMLIEDTFHDRYDAIVGINLLKKWGVAWEMDDERTTLCFRRNGVTGLNLRGKDYKPKKKIPLENVKTKMKMVRSVVVESMQTLNVLVTLEQGFHESHGNLVEVIPDIEDLGMSSTPSVVKLEKESDQFLLQVTNEADQPIYLLEDMEVGTVKVYKEPSYKKEIPLELNTASVELDYKYPTREISCSCRFRVDRDVNLIIFNNEFGENAHRHQIINGMHPLEKWRKAPRVICDDDHILNGSIPNVNQVNHGN